MKYKWIALLALVFGLSAVLVAAEKPVTLEGTLVDASCYLKDNSFTGNDHGGVKNCGTLCLRSGKPAGILTKDKKFHAIIAPGPALADDVGKPVRVTGTLHNGSILPEKIEVQKDGKWQEVKL